MKHVIVEIPEEKYPLFIELLNNLSFVKGVEVEDNSTNEAKKGIRTTAKDAYAVSEHKRKAVGLDRFLSGL